MQDVLSFSNTDVEGVPWWTYFDSKTRKLKYAKSGSLNQGTTEVEFFVTSWRPRTTFFDSEFQMCHGDVELVN
jgi:hypothetical protein